MGTTDTSFKVVHKVSAVLNFTIPVGDLRAIQKQTIAIASDFLWLKDIAGFDATTTHRWNMLVSPNSPYPGKKLGDLDYVAVAMKLTTDDVIYESVKSRIFLKVFAGDKWTVFGGPYERDVAPGTDFGVHKAILHRDLFGPTSKLVSEDGMLALRAELNFEVAAAPGFQHGSFLCRRQAHMFQSKECADAVLVSKDKKEFPVHSTILAAHSPVFRDMFSHAFKQMESRRVEINDIDGEILDIVLQYIYSGTVARVTENAELVLEAADKYDISDLRKLTVSHLCGTITTDNAYRVLVVADQRNLRALSKLVSGFIVKNWDSLRGTPDFVLAKERYGPLFTLLEEFGSARKKIKTEAV